jgi:protein-tyrosine phosphatase
MNRAALKTFAQRILPRSTAEVVRDCRAMPACTAITYIRLRAWRRIGLRSDRAILRGMQPQSVLFVCHGNIMRSPMAAEVFRDRMEKLGRTVGVGSVGTWTTNGRKADPRAIAAATEFGISLENHRSRSITEAIVANSDLICVMDHRNEVDVLTRFPGAAKKTVLLAGVSAAQRASQEIPDPYMLGPDGVSECYRRLVPAIDALIRSLGLD